MFGLAGIDWACGGEHLGCELRERWELHGRTYLVEKGVADVQPGGVDEPDNVAGERFVDRGPLGSKDGRGILGCERFSCSLACHHHAAVELAGTDAGEGDSVAVVAVHVGLDLEHKCRARLIKLARIVVDVESR